MEYGVIDEVRKIAGLKDTHDAADLVALRVIADHIRSVASLYQMGSAHVKVGAMSLGDSCGGRPAMGDSLG